MADSCASRCLIGPFSSAVMSPWLSMYTTITFPFVPDLRINVIRFRPSLTARDSAANGSV